MSEKLTGIEEDGSLRKKDFCSHGPSVLSLQDMAVEFAPSMVASMLSPKMFTSSSSQEQAIGDKAVQSFFPSHQVQNVFSDNQGGQEKGEWAGRQKLASISCFSFKSNFIPLDVVTEIGQILCSLVSERQANDGEQF